MRLPPRLGGPRRLASAPAVAAVALLLAAASTAQDDPQEPHPVLEAQRQIERLQGRTVRSIVFTPRISYTRRQILGHMRTQEGEAMDRRLVQADLETLFRRLKLRVDSVVVREVSDEEVELVFTLTEIPSFENVVFRGLSRFTEDRVRDMIGLARGQRASEFTARPQARLLEERYRAEGYMYVEVDVQSDTATGTLVFNVHEGPRVGVGSVEFVGNEAFPARAFLRLRPNLVGSSGMLTRPGFLFFRSPPFSMKTLEEDLDRLRDFYRQNGYLDARVEIFDLVPSRDRTSMDVKILVDEGPRYVIWEVDIEIEPGEGKEDPEYTKEEVMRVLRLKAGAHYNRQVIRRDREALRRFYGERGHPSTWDIHGLVGDDPSLFFAYPPREIYHEHEPRVKVVFRLREGRRKRVREVKVRGNESTRDRVVRRQLSVYPDELLDTVELTRSRGRLEALHYFETEEGFSGARVRLRPVADPDMVDVEVDVQEGKTGNIIFGGGVSTNHGFFGNVSYRKHNFDISRPPRGYNPLSWISQIFTGDVFHGGGQTLLIDLVPGTLHTRGSVSFHEPDILGGHVDTIGMKLDAYRVISLWDSYLSDTLGGMAAFDRRFGHSSAVTLSFRHETADLRRIAADAPTLVWDQRGSTEIRAARLAFNYEDLDNRFLPASGLTASLYTEYGGDLLGGGTDFVKAGLSAELYVPLHRDEKDRPFVFHLHNRFDAAGGLGDTRRVHPNERFYMGGQGLVRGFDFRRAGPSQFGNPVGGEARWMGGMEMQFPILSVRPERGDLGETEIIRGAFFVDAGLLGLSLHDRTFREPRLSAGLGLRVRIPGLGFLPLALDFARPILFEETDDRRFFHVRLGLR